MAGDIGELLNPACCVYLKNKSQVFFRSSFLLAVALILICHPLLSSAQILTHDAVDLILPSDSVSIVVMTVFFFCFFSGGNRLVTSARCKVVTFIMSVAISAGLWQRAAIPHNGSWILMSVQGW